LSNFAGYSTQEAGSFPGNYSLDWTQFCSNPPNVKFKYSVKMRRNVQ
jgi:hypothetical protein